MKRFGFFALAIASMAMLAAPIAAQNLTPPASTDYLLLSRRDANGVGSYGAVPVANAFNGVGVGYGGAGTGVGGAVTQLTSRTTGVTLSTYTGAITLFSAAGSATATSFTVTNTLVEATDTIVVVEKSGTNLYVTFVTAVAAGSFQITFFTTGGTATDAPVFTYAVIKAKAS